MLTEQQKEAVDAPTAKHLAIYAVAGSGKTTMLVQRIKRLVREGQSRILVITFTRKAADNLKSRLGEMPKGVFVGTFHGFCLSVLKAVDPTYAKTAILDKDDLKVQIWCRQVIEETKSSASVADVLNAVDKAAAAGRHHLDMVPSNSQDDLLVRALKEKMLKERSILFQDLLLDMLRKLRLDQQFRQAIQARFPVVMVDEFQDTDLCQISLLQFILGGSGHLTAVGDVSQAIYASFRYCDPKFLMNIESYVGPTTVLSMTRNFRSGGKILTAANAVIQKNVQRSPVLLDVLDNLGVITVDRCGDALSEAMDIAKAVKESGAPWKESAVLYRVNAQSGPIEMALSREDVPFDTGDVGSFFEITEVRTLISYLKLATDPRDLESLIYVWNKPTRFLKTDIVTAACSRTVTGNCLDVVDDILKQKLTMPQRRGVSVLRGLLIELHRSPSPAAAIRLIMEKTAYEGWLRSLAGANNKKPLSDYQANVSMLIAMSRRSATTAALLSEIARTTERHKRSKKEGRDAVQLMTVHRSKGLEFDRVFLAGACETLFPHAEAVTQGNLEEERRLMYVALTRPRKELHVYWHGQPSQFLEEAGIHAEEEAEHG